MKKNVAKRVPRKKGELLLEIGTEEIPSGVIRPAMESLKHKTVTMLSEARIPAERVEVFATPRRFVILATGVRDRQVSEVLEVIGPPRSAAYDAEGRPKPAASGFAKSQGVPVQSLKIKTTEKGDYLVAVKKQPSHSARQVLLELLPGIISGMTFPKTMRWNEHGLKFSRPIRWILAVHDGATLPFRIAGLASGNLSYGHRTLGNRSFIVKNHDGYRKNLKRLHVVLDPAEREKIIQKDLYRLIAKKKGRCDRLDAELLEQAIFLTEDPVVFMGGFDPLYLDLPREVLVTVMKDHQGYFPVWDKGGSLLPFFLFVSNIQSKKPDLVRQGNERVLRARLEDARFYYEQDKQGTLNKYKDLLKGLVFHEKLGNMQMKMERIKEMAGALMGWAHKSDKEISRVQQAALLCKCDLLTGMVREFPSLQGIMGREYAIEQGEDREVADAIAEHYFPRRADDPNPPRTPAGKFLTAADRLDNLIGFFGVGLNPTGSMDPYGLRRQGLGLIQVLLDEAFTGLMLAQAIDRGIKLYADRGTSLKKDPGTILRELQVFLGQRMETYLERRFGSETGYRPDLAAVVLARPFDNPLDLFLRFVSLMSFARSPDFEPLILTFKRTSRIIPEGFSGTINPDRLTELVERDLHRDYLKTLATAGQLIRDRNYINCLQVLAELRQPIDRFFDGVMVMDKDQAKQENRLALLNGIKGLFADFGDLSRVVVDERVIVNKAAEEPRQTALAGSIESKGASSHGSRTPGV